MTKNVLYYGDNLDILRRYIPDESVDLIYLDPPFNSSRSYNVLFRESNGTEPPAQIRAFEDSWTWDQKAVETLEDLTRTAPASLVKLLDAFIPFLGHSPMMAYLVMMAIRLVELHRVLKPTGSIYLHCDPTASHYLKTVMDGVFGAKHFVNEIIWRRTTTKNDYRQGAKIWPRVHDVILHCAKDYDSLAVFNQAFSEYSPEYLEKFYKYVDEDGRRYTLSDLAAPGAGSRGHPRYEFMGVTRYWRYNKEKMEKLLAEGRIIQRKPGAVPRYKRYLDEMPGVAIGDEWDDIAPIGAQAAERLGYPTQKPLALLERIIQASSNEGDLVLDPFCGCGTTVDAAQHLGRKWIGIDITHVAISLIRRRLKDRYGEAVQFRVIGEPQDEGSARALAQQDRHQFQSWALDQIDARPAQEKKGSDQGVDGVMFFSDDGETIRRAIVQVKSGHVGVGQIYSLLGTLHQQNDDKDRAPIGIFLTLEQPTGPMISEAASAGFYVHPLIPDRRFPRLQILTVRDLFEGKRPDLPYSASFTYAKAEAAAKRKVQETLKL